MRRGTDTVVARELIATDFKTEYEDKARALTADRWEVQQQFGSSWENVWQEDEKPLTFDSKGEAQRDLDEFFLEEGDGAGYDPDEFRVVKIKDSVGQVSDFLVNAIRNLKLFSDVEPGEEIKWTYLYRANKDFEDAVSVMEKYGDDKRREDIYKVIKRMGWDTTPRSYSSPITLAGVKIDDAENKGYAVNDASAIGKFQRKIKRFIAEVKKVGRSL